VKLLSRTSRNAAVVTRWSN